MKILKQFFVIMLFYALGSMMSHVIGNFIPGSVLGMFFLFIALRLKIIQPHHVDSISYFLTSIMGLLFVPAGVGLVTQLPIIKQYWHIILLSMVLSTIMVMAVVAIAQQRFEQYAKKLQHQKQLRKQLEQEETTQHITPNDN